MMTHGSCTSNLFTGFYRWSEACIAWYAITFTNDFKCMHAPSVPADIAISLRIMRIIAALVQYTRAAACLSQSFKELLLADSS